jgi:outer membrane immunogenic protein
LCAASMACSRVKVQTPFVRCFKNGLRLDRGVLACAVSRPGAPVRAARAPGPVAFVPPPPVFTWSGIYIGGNGGYSFGTTTPSIGELRGPGFSTNGTVAGGTIGGNYQAGVFVFGVEGDFDWDNIKGNP